MSYRPDDPNDLFNIFCSYIEPLLHHKEQEEAEWDNMMGANPNDLLIWHRIRKCHEDFTTNPE